MADYKEVLSRVCKEKLSGIILNPEQKEAIISILNGKDIFAMLSYQLILVFAKEIINGHLPAVTVEQWHTGIQHVTQSMDLHVKSYI